MERDHTGQIGESQDLRFYTVSNGVEGFIAGE